MLCGKLNIFISLPVTSLLPHLYVSKLRVAIISKGIKFYLDMNNS